MSWNHFIKTGYLLSAIMVIGLVLSSQSTEAANRVTGKKGKAFTSKEMSQLINTLVKKELSRQDKSISEPVSDVDFIRRVMFDLTGKLPTPAEVTYFGIDPDQNKNQKKIDQLIASDEYGVNWSKYWWDVIYSKATEQRAQMMKNSFEEWMAQQLNENKSWDHITTEMVTATGDIRKNGATAIIYAQSGNNSDIASEVARLFLGIQIQCANCHDHLTDKWKREEFHQLASFFPRLSVRVVKGDGPRSFEVKEKIVRGEKPIQMIQRIRKNAKNIVKKYDKNNDKKLTKQELKKSPFRGQMTRLLRFADTNSDKALSVKELKNISLPANAKRLMTEHYMPDLDDPSNKGKRMDPIFFLTGEKVTKELNDEERRGKLAELITSKDNEWFAKALINRLWYELIGEGFYTPVDDIGPERTAIFPEVLNALTEGFIKSGYDVKWLTRSILLTDIYRQGLATGDEHDISFAAARTGRYRSDQLYDAITQVLGVEQAVGVSKRPQRRDNSPRGQFKTLFGYDPSLSQSDIKGSVPQALFMMNSLTVNKLLTAKGNTRLARKLDEFKNNEDLVSELYLMVLSREPNAEELKICLVYIKEIGNKNEAVEDVLWSLLNSSEFLSKK